MIDKRTFVTKSLASAVALSAAMISNGSSAEQKFVIEKVMVTA